MKHEELTRKIIGAAMAVLNELKPGLDEKLYENALVIELAARGHGAVPIRSINADDAADKSRRDKIVQLAEQMPALASSFLTARTPQEKTALERQIAATDAQLDKLVYDLYGLTEDEIKIVEGATA